MNKILEKLEKKVDDVNEMTDENNPKYMFQGTDIKLVVAIASGKINAKEYAKFEMVNRGFGKKGEWIGFPEAEKLWKPKVK